jgi:ATP-dependent helicase/nuclease subunit B
MGGRRLALDEVYHGLSLQLLTYLLVLQASGHELAGKRLEPVAAFYVQMIRRLDDVGHPNDGMEPDDPAFHLRVKPRGILDTNYVAQFDGQLTNGVSPVISARINKDGSFGARNATDVAAPAEFSALLGHVRRRLGELADGIMLGNVSIAPYMKGEQTPCPSCAFKSVCRFDQSLNQYNVLERMGREDVLRRVIEEKGA